MLQLIQKYAAVLRFLFTFLGVYLLLALLYNFYLNSNIDAGYHPDFLTQLVGLQSGALVEAMGYQTQVHSGHPEASMHLFVNGKFVARIIEGCNAASIIILFVSFMIAFAGKFGTTLLYAFAGSVIIYATNILRIGLMAIGIYEYPGQAHFLHTIAFPLVIYGMVFLLWIVWVALYSKQIGP